MTTPNNQPTPPPGMEILTDYTKPLPEGAKLWIPELENIAGFWDFSGNIGLKPSLGFIYAIPITVPATGGTTNEKGCEQQERWPKDRLKAIPHERDVSTWYIATESDGLLIGCIQCIVAEGFAKGLVETWNASLESRK